MSTKLRKPTLVVTQYKIINLEMRIMSPLNRNLNRENMKKHNG